MALLAILVSAPALADSTTFDATGRAPIAGGDRVKARERALDDAFRHALEGAIGALLGADALVKKAADLRLKIMPRARSYVQSFRVIDEGEHEPNMFSVQISAEVAADRLLRELADRSARPAKPPTKSGDRLLLCGEGSAPLKAFASALRARLSVSGFELISAARCDEGSLVAELGSSGARGALVIDVATSTPAAIRGTSLVGVEQKTALHLVDATGRRWAEGKVEGSGYGADLDAAIDAAAVHGLPELMSAIEPALAPQADSARSGGVPVRVLGVRRYPQLTNVRSALERLPGVDAVEPRRFNPGAPGSIELSVKTTLPLRAILDALRRVAGTYQLGVREIDGAIIVDVPETGDPGAGAPEPRSAQ